MSKRYIFGGIALIVILPIAALGWWLLSPLLVDQTIDEPLPFAAQAFIPPGMTKAEVEDVMAGMAKLTKQMDDVMTSMAKLTRQMDYVMADMAGMAQPVVPADMTRYEVDDVMVGMAMLTRPVDEPMPDKMMMGAEDSSGGSSTTAALESAGTAVVLSKGTFQDADRFHQGSGEAIIYRAPDGSYLLRLENFKVTNGPDLHVILSTHPAPQSRDDVHQAGYIDLDSLKGNVGNQNYEIPADVDVNALASIVIYCAPFHVVFAVAPLKRAG